MSYFIIESVIKVKLRIKDLREDHDLTQKQIANVLMCDQSLYSKYERGEREIPLTQLCGNAIILGSQKKHIGGSVHSVP